MSRSKSHSIPPQRERSSSWELDADYVNESHIKSFAEALQAEDITPLDHPEPTSPGLSPTVFTPTGPRVRKVSALSDFAPVNLKVKKRKRTGKPQQKRQEWLFLVLRWPLLAIIFLIMAVQFSLYILIRQLVNAKEWLSAWRGRKGILRKRLRSAKTYQEWKDAALVLDEYLHFDEWKTTDEDPYYDWKLVRKVRRSLRNLREKKDARGVLGVLETSIRTNFAGVESARLYSETFYGTKDLIESYITEQEKAIEYVRDTPDLSLEEKKRFFKSANTNLGTSALCLSGGASFGYYHFGVVKAFLDADLLPRVISGTSAGGLVAALVCTRTDTELKHLLVPDLANRITAFEEPFHLWYKRFWTTGARFDSVLWARKACFFTRGSTTFKEAYMRTGRILNISVIPAERHSPTKLLNYITAPDTVIWSALLASAAVPGILNPVVLMEKLKDGTIVPWSWGSKFKDGSLRVDIPVQSLNLYFNVTHPVVSQVNPHVHLFFFAPRGSAGKPVAHRKGKGWRGNFVLSAAEQWLKLELTKNFKLIRDLDLLPELLGQDWSSVFLQRFDGTVTIWPRTIFKDWLRILSDPDPVELDRMLQVGQLVTWPKLHIFENRYRLEKQIILGRQAVRRATRAHGQERSTLRTAELQERDPLPSADTKLFANFTPPVFTPPITLTTSEGPIPIDSDAEAAYLNGSLKDEHYLRTHPPARSQDCRRSSVRRRQWVTNTSHHDERDVLEEGDFGGATPDPPPPTSTESNTPPHPAPQPPLSANSAAGFFKRLRTGSLSSTFSPFASLRRNSRLATSDSHQDSLLDPSYSGDSSSDDELSVISLRRSRVSSLLDIRPDQGLSDEESDDH